MKANRCALACALALASGSALSQEAKMPNTAVVADTLIQLYGHLDLSLDVATKGIHNGDTSKFAGMPATGKLGWQPDLSSNLSYIGVRGGREVAPALRLVYQVETQIDLAATPGTSSNTASSDANVKGAWASRNSFIGLAGDWGAVKGGKTDTPYKTSTARMDPFSATVGDYNSIMGNTGGDNRAEFDSRLSHSVWYESPNFGGIRFNVLFSPGQNRSSDNSVNASGEPDCTGGNGGFGATVQGDCTDGAFGNAYSADLVYSAGPLYAIGAYERHVDVNRTGDEAGGLATPGTIGVQNEQAWKIGAQYKLAATTLNAIFERMTRNDPDNTFNERRRNGYWLAGTQKVSDKDDVNLGWAHAGKTPGDPVQGPVDNASNLISVGYKHHWDRQANFYAVYARQANHSGSHFDLGASGHGITTDCHDANGGCFPGTTLQALSVGVQYNF